MAKNPDPGDEVKQPLVYLLVLNYGTPEDCLECIAAVRNVRYSRMHLLVIDNASADNSLELLRPVLQHDELLVLPINTGYAGGNNEGIGIALDNDADYIFIINPDVRISPGSIASYVSLMEKDRSISALNPIQLSVEGDTMDEIFRREMFDYNDYETPALPLKSEQLWEVKTLFGAALLLSRDIVEKVGGFDPLYFAYWEEVDLCRRIKYHGGRLFVTASEPVVHLRNYKNPRDPFRRYLRLKGMYLFQLKDQSRSYPGLLKQKFRELANNILRPNDGGFDWERRDYLRVFWWCAVHAFRIRLHRKLDRLGRAYV
jgi:GT2 family glycosyltransferase